MPTVEAIAHDVIDEILRERLRLMTVYHIHADEIIGFAIGPNEWLVLREQLRSMCVIPELTKSYEARTMICGIQIYVTPHPGILPLFSEKCFWVAVEESRKRYENVMDA